jgi:hypothetical protein
MFTENSNMCYYNVNIIHTLLLAQNNTPPMGAKSTPMTKKVGRTDRGVNTGCHAFNRCCLKAESITKRLMKQTK